MKRTVGIIVAIVVAAGGWWLTARMRGTAKDASPTKKAPLVAVTIAQKGSIAEALSLTGSVEARTVVDILPKLEQRIVWMPAREGDRVIAGQVVARLDSLEHQRQLDQALADVRVNEASLRDLQAGARPEEIAQAKALLEQATASQERGEALLRNLRSLYGQQGVPQQAIDEATGKVHVNESQARAADVQVADAELDLGRVRQVVAIGGTAKQEEDRAKTRLETARAQQRAARAALHASRAALEHVKTLYGGPIPRREIDEAEGKVREAKSAVQAAKEKLGMLRAGPTPTQVAVARERVAQASAKLASARVMLQYCSITAPLNGVVVRRHAEVGDMAAPRSPLLSIANTGQVLVRAAVSETDAARFRVGMAVFVAVDGQPGPPLRSRISTVYPAADPGSRLIMVKVPLPSSSGTPLLGSLARVSVLVHRSDGSVVIPSAATVQRAGGKRIAFVVGQDDKASEREIETGIETNDKVEVLRGIAAGERLVVKGQEMLKDGSAVKAMAPKTGRGKGAGKPSEGPKGAPKQ